MRRNKTHDEYVEELKIVNPNLEVLETYIDSRTKILHRCLIHNVIWYKCPCNALKGGGCKQCAADILSSKFLKTHEKYVSDLCFVNPNVDVLERYKGACVKIKHKCKLDGYEWYTTPSNILNGKKCPLCSKSPTMSHELYLARLSKINSNVIPLETYINSTTKILHKCSKCSNEWRTIPDVVLRGCGCPKCGNKKIGEKLVKTHEQYKVELAEHNPNIDVIGSYVNSLTAIKHRCKIDGYEWMVSPSHLLSGTGCPLCSNSKGETMIKKWLDSHNVKYVVQKRFKGCKDKRTLPFDFYLPERNTCIEYDGEQHYRPVRFGGISVDDSDKRFEYVKYHDEIKNNYCKSNNIKLIRIPYFKDVYKELDLLLI